MKPRISVLIPTVDRPALLADCLASLSRSTFTDAEVLVLDQSRGTDRSSLGPQGAGCLEVRHLHCPRRGKTAALNFGIRKARGDLLAFTDDDCQVAEDWLEVIDRAAREDGGSCALTGRVLAAPPEGEGGRVPDVCVEEEQRTYTSPALRDVLFGGNMAIPAKLLLRVGSFDENLGPGTEAPAAEESDLGYRILRAGVPIRYLPAMVVTHRSVRSESEMVATFRGYGKGQGAFYGKYVRKGDLHMMSRVVWNLLQAGRELGGGLLTGKRYPRRIWSAFTVGLVEGFVRSALKGGPRDARIVAESEEP